ncbi:hypothetical protein TRIATDRAFT_256565 [Trichoderma atroviride IMI 206040]|uniref:Secreted protein n=1 Tax=Hypocrea atroviridis (strain ATCC 20476 / IMI 206040) TaxID=452589 RepID=G9NRT6_HYPAI|nr:uncharacterized protein TRIATDRAFT_299237 [Trichoderma atroviride IMI 206040]EHK46718.1 hypothetical protein TRIATDRAFT_256565 [Trichoderma atroviride IMI 206040]
MFIECSLVPGVVLQLVFACHPPSYPGPEIQFIDFILLSHKSVAALLSTTWSTPVSHNTCPPRHIQDTNLSLHKTFHNKTLHTVALRNSATTRN